MKARYLCVLTVALGLGLWLAGERVAQTQQPAPPPSDQAAEPAPPQGVDVMARGPVHEAYAAPVNPRPQASPVVLKQPPDPVPETPPDQRPEGDNVVWIPGYWAWDDASQDFLWVSGFWRDVPPGQQWVPGHWQQAQDGWQWAPGFWSSADQNEVEYLPPPPASIDSGPSIPAPDENSFYVPGCWVHEETRYLWRPGFWLAYQPDWVWCPAHYVWCPAGHVFIDGYWDHPLGTRGLLFAPCRFQRDLLASGDFVFTPSYVVQPDFLIGALFVRPANYCYYFGDYFDRRFEDLGYVPWVDYRVSRTSYDPLFTYYSHTLGEERWRRAVRNLYTARFEDRVPRPPHTLSEQRRLVEGRNENNANAQIVQALMPIARADNMRVTALASLAGVKEPRNAPVLRLQPVPREQRTVVEQHAKQLREAAQHRHEVEAKLRTQEPAPGRPAEQPKRANLNLPKPPAAPARPERPAAKTPPPRPQPPKHEERPIPRQEPPRTEPAPRTPPREPAPWRPEEPRREPPPQRPEERPQEPRREPPPPPRPEQRPQEPRRQPPSPEPPDVKPPPPPRREPPPPQQRPPEPRREPPPAPPRPEPPHHKAPRPEPPPKERPHEPPPKEKPHEPPH